MPLELGRRGLAIGGGAIALLLALYLLFSGPDRQSAPEPVSVAEPPPPPPVAAAPVAPAPTPPPEGLRLHGVTGAGAIIAMADGSQRLVMIGREIVPGVRLQSVAVDHAILQSGASRYRLDFAGVSTVAGAAPSASGPSSEAATRAETLRYRLALAPRRVGGRITSHVVRPGAVLPDLQRAGLLPGDVILRVNGSEFDEERLLDLAWTVRNSDRVEFEIERGGRPMRLAGQGSRAR